MTTIEPKPKRSGSIAPVPSRNLEPILDNQLKVRTPENIEFMHEVAGPFRRVCAYILDIIISQVALYLVAIAIAIVLSIVTLLLGNVGTAGFIQTIWGVYLGMFFAVAFLSSWFYGAICETYLNGQTFGKKFLNLRVLSSDGNAIDGAQATLRNFFRLFDMMPLVGTGLLFGAPEEMAFKIPTALFGLIAMLVSRKHQRLGDLVAGTIVVSEKQRWTHGLAEFEDDRVARLAELIPSGFEVSASLATALSDFVDRRRFLPYQRVAEIAAHLGAPLTEEFGLPKDTNHDLLLCSLYYKTFVDELPNENGIPVAKLDTSPPIATTATTDQGMTP